MTSGKRRTALLVIVLLSGSIAGALWANRKSTVEFDGWGVATIQFHWFTVSRIEVDWNRDGDIDFIGVVRGRYRTLFSHMSFSEVWLSTQGDSVLDTNIVWSGETRRVMLDKNGDGVYETVVPTEEVDRTIDSAYSNMRRRGARD